jgi:PIN domain
MLNSNGQLRPFLWSKLFWRVTEVGEIEILCRSSAAEFKLIFASILFLFSSLRLGASREDVSAVLDELASVGKKVELLIRTRPMLLDPNDEMVLETAINGRADAIVTFNERDFRPAAARFRCSVVRPGKVVLGLAEETE